MFWALWLFLFLLQSYIVMEFVGGRKVMVKQSGEMGCDFFFLEKKWTVMSRI